MPQDDQVPLITLTMTLNGTLHADARGCPGAQAGTLLREVTLVGYLGEDEDAAEWTMGPRYLDLCQG